MNNKQISNCVSCGCAVFPNSGVYVKRPKHAYKEKIHKCVKCNHCVNSLNSKIQLRKKKQHAKQVIKYTLGRNFA